MTSTTIRPPARRKICSPALPALETVMTTVEAVDPEAAMAYRIWAACEIDAQFTVASTIGHAQKVAEMLDLKPSFRTTETGVIHYWIGEVLKARVRLVVLIDIDWPEP